MNKPFRILILFASLLVAAPAPGQETSAPELAAALAGSPGPFGLAVDGREGLFLLDRGRNLLLRLDPGNGQVRWSIDGSEGGERFLDPAFLSRGDGFFLYLTDQGARKVWRIDYRGELRGSLELPFAADPLLCELVAGRQLLVYDRAGGLVHLLDDSGRPLWSFPPGAGNRTAEPSALAVSPDGGSLLLLWAERRELTVMDLYGRGARSLELPPQATGASRLTAVSAVDGATLAVLALPGDSLLVLDLAGRVRGCLPMPSPLLALASHPRRAGCLWLLAGDPPRLSEILLEPPD